VISEIERKEDKETNNNESKYVDRIKKHNPLKREVTT
jgi:hypothetical protein